MIRSYSRDEYFSGIQESLNGKAGWQNFILNLYSACMFITFMSKMKLRTETTFLNIHRDHGKHLTSVRPESALNPKKQLITYIYI